MLFNRQLEIVMSINPCFIGKLKKIVVTRALLRPRAVVDRGPPLARALPCAGLSYDGTQILGTPSMRNFWWLAALLGLSSATAHAADVEVGPADNWRGAIDTLRPGNTVWMRAGTYTVSGLFRIQLNGTASQPIAVRAVAGARSHIVQSSGLHNVVEINNSSHLLLEGLELSGGGGDGVRILTANDLSLRNLLIRDVPQVGIIATAPGSTFARLVVEGVEIRQARRGGIDLGCSDARCSTVDAVIRRNWIHSLSNPSGNFNAVGLRISTGSSGALVEDNVLHDVDIGMFVLSTLGNGNPHLVRRNFIWNARRGEVILVSHTVFENNVVLGSTEPSFPSINVFNNQATATAITLRNNTVIAPSSKNALRLRQVNGSTLIVNNALFSQFGRAIDIQSSTGVSVLNNAGEGSVIGSPAGFTVVGSPTNMLAAASYSGTVPQDLVPIAGSPLIGAANVGSAPASDFDEVTRDASPDIGALERGGDAADRWTPAPGFKRAPRIYRNGFEE